MKISRLIVITMSISVILFSCKKEQGCTDITACNFSATAEENDGSCYSPGDDCDDGDANTINDTYNSSCDCLGTDPPPPNYGCTDSSACNYNPNADTDDNGCLYIGDPCDDFNSNTQNDIYIETCACVGESIVYGCMTSTACNFNPNANHNDGSCYFPGDPCDDNNSSTINDAYNSNCDCVGTTSVSGCMDSSACNYNSNATTNDNSCEYPGDSCDDGDPNTSGDTLNSNCDCVGTPPSDNECSLNSEGYAPVTFGIYSDSYYSECQFRVHATADDEITTPWVAGTQAGINEEDYYNFGFGSWTMEVEDSFGDGKGSSGYYFATCTSNSGNTITLVNTPFTTGYSSSTEFTIGTGVANPVISDNN